MKTLILDTETNGLPPRRNEIPKGYELPYSKQPGIFQLCAVLYDGREIAAQFETYIRPINADGEYETVPKTRDETKTLIGKLADPEARKAMTDEEIERVAFLVKDEHRFNKLLIEGKHDIGKIDNGIECKDAMTGFAAMAGVADRLIAHNSSFDIPVLKAALERCGMDKSILDDANVLCSAETLTPYMKLPMPNQKYKRQEDDYKTPNLTEAYEKLTGKARDNTAHDAMGDVETLADIVWKIDDLIEAGEDIGWLSYDWKLSERPISNGIWVFGKHRGKPIASLPGDYIEWVFNKFDTELLKEDSEFYSDSLATQLMDALEAWNEENREGE